MNTIEKEDKRKGLIATILFHILLVLLLVFATFSTTIPPFPDDEIVMEMDFTGSESSGGAPQEVTESVTEESSAETEDVATQDEESPVEVNVDKTNTSESNSNTNTDNTTETESQDPKYTFNNVFGSGNDGSGTGDSDGDGKDGQGDGIDGPGTSGNVGSMSGRNLLSKPSVENPIQQEGDVRVKIWIDRSGTVVQVKVLTTDPKTTSTSQAHFDAAAKAAKKFRFAPDSGGKDKEYGHVIIEFRNQ